MRPLSPTQLSTLRKIEEFGLTVPTVTLDGAYAMAHLDLPWPGYEIVRVQTVRRLARDGLIAPLEYTGSTPTGTSSSKDGTITHSPAGVSFPSSQPSSAGRWAPAS